MIDEKKDRTEEMSQDMAGAVKGLEDVAKGSIYDCDAFLQQIAL